MAHTYAAAGRYPVQLKVTDLSAASTNRFDHYEAEDAAQSGGVVTSTDRAGFSGSGFADYPASGDGGTKVTWSNVIIGKAGHYGLQVRFANGDATGSRKLTLRVNGGGGVALDFPASGNWNAWQLKGVEVDLAAGANSVELVADAGTAGPNSTRSSCRSCCRPRARQFKSCTCRSLRAHQRARARSPSRRRTSGPSIPTKARSLCRRRVARARVRGRCRQQSAHAGRGAGRHRVGICEPRL